MVQVFFFQTCEMKHAQGSSSNTVCSSERSEAPTVNTSESQGLHVIEFCLKQNKESNSLKCLDTLQGM